MKASPMVQLYTPRGTMILPDCDADTLGVSENEKSKRNQEASEYCDDIPSVNDTKNKGGRSDCWVLENIFP